MKKFFIMGMAAMGLALTACNNDETVEVAKGNAISFNSFVNKSTRGAADDVTLKNLVLLNCTAGVVMTYSSTSR